ncbi:hypothetical protein [Beijerinckia sp. L45]|uniref:hypothetical protein n=1 Tax=Beijerinckia sp. L45 TaxID=1641855 RepID=UPI00131C0993|nr:hypothetical protein [Beijerinckia sp. L45]
MKIPEFVMIYDDPRQRYNTTYSGNIVVEGVRMTARLACKNKDDEHSDVCFIVFNTPKDLKIKAQVGFMCGFRNPYAPYCGAHLLCCQDYMTTAEAATILSGRPDLWFEDFETSVDTVLESRSRSESGVRGNRTGRG